MKKDLGTGVDRTKEFIKLKKKGSKKMICEMFGVHSKSIYKTTSSKKFYFKAEDEEILSQIRSIVSLRPTYGYKRVTAMVNRLRLTLGHPRLKKKRIYRIMRINGLLLPKSAVMRTHNPTGKVMTLHSNTRWCSDCFEIKCFTEEKVFVSFVLIHVIEKSSRL